MCLTESFHAAAVRSIHLMVDVIISARFSSHTFLEVPVLSIGICDFPTQQASGTGYIERHHLSILW